MVVTSVRDGRAGMPSQGGVDLEVSTKVIVIFATGAELVAPTACVGAATPAKAVAGRSRPQATAPNSAVRCIGLIPFSLPDETPSCHKHCFVSRPVPWGVQAL